MNNFLSHSRNLRKGRYSESGRIYFVTSSCFRRRRVFSSDRAAKILSIEFLRVEIDGVCENLAFVVMPDHFHWLVQLNGGSTISHAVRLVKGRSARCLNRGKISGQENLATELSRSCGTQRRRHRESGQIPNTQSAQGGPCGEAGRVPLLVVNLAFLASSSRLKPLPQE